MTALRRYLGAALAARFASEGVGIAVLMLALERTGSAAYGAYVLTAWLAPHVLAAPLAGAAAGRTRRPRLFHVGALAGFALAMAGLALLIGRVPAPLVLALAVAGGSCGPMVTGGLSSLVAGLVPAGPGLDRAYAWDATTYNGAAVSAPAVVGALAAFGSAGPAVLVLACGAALAAVLAATLPYARPAAGPRGPVTLRAGMAAGLAALWRVRELRAITASTTLAFVGLGAMSTTAVLLADRLRGAGGGGVLLTAFAVGALAGSLTLGRITVVAPGRLARWGMAGTGCALAGAASAPSVPVAAALFALAGVCDGPLLTATLRIRSEHAPASARTQVFTLGAGLKVTAASAGAALAGLAAGAPPQALLLAVAGFQAAGALLHLALTPKAPTAAGRPELPAAALPTARTEGPPTAPSGRPGAAGPGR
ncbi:MFS transporter [Streptomyces sp. WAC06614]|uniref:MFS transporter n=1 Tax=Streptomyces sp. WAC06614 TaxID=2487416 RepID=UPI000F79FCE9|nr:MFS transporter [Streptomyces sp. WAC06614]RSS78634.1 MFS transporter [Streptomyces sp. WAC06614]